MDLPVSNEAPLRFTPSHPLNEPYRLAQQSTETLPTYNVSCNSSQDKQYSLEQAKHVSRTLSAIDLDTMATVLEKKPKGLLSTAWQITKDGKAKWSYKTGGTCRILIFSRQDAASSNKDACPPSYDSIHGAQEIQLVSAKLNPLIFCFKYTDMMHNEWQLAWMRKENYDSVPYNLSVYQWKELVCVDRASRRVLARIQRAVRNSCASGHLTISSALLPDLQEFILVTAMAVYNAYPSKAPLKTSEELSKYRGDAIAGSHYVPSLWG